MPRSYDMTRRARRAAETRERIADTTERLLTEGLVRDVTLEAIAAGSGVTVQTVLRHMGSRDGCIDAVRQRVQARIDAQRGSTPPADVEAALFDLIDHYETEGRLVLNLLSQEASDAFAREAVDSGRAYHRAWVVRCLGGGSAGPEAVDALVAATDLYVWKLLRLDLKRSPEATLAVITRLVRAVLEAS